MKDSFTDINVVPLVDIMLVLITIVLITANFVISGAIPVSLPKSSAEMESVHEAVILSIDKEGRTFIDNIEVPIELIATELVSRDNESPVFIRPDKELTIQPFVSVIEILKDSGFTKISIQTEK